MGRTLRIGLLLGFLAVSGCAILSRPGALTPDEVRALLRDRLGTSEAAEFEVPFELDHDTRILARSAVRGSIGEFAQAEALVSAILSEDGLGVGYDRSSTLSAQHARILQSANCLAFTNLFIGMAREVGLDAVYVEVGTLDQRVEEGSIQVNFGHTCGGVQSDNSFLVVDFSERPTRGYPYYRILSDLEAIASYWNNRGYEAAWYRDPDRQDPGTETDLEYYRKAIQIYPQYAVAYNNLGAGLEKRGRLEEANSAYREALRHDPNLAEAHANLALLHLKQGNALGAAENLRRATKSSPTNPYYWYRYGTVMMQLQRYDKARSAFSKAVRRKQGRYPKAQEGVAEALLRMGRREDARKALIRLLEQDPSNRSARLRLARLDPENRGD